MESPSKRGKMDGEKNERPDTDVRQLLCLVECYVLERQFLGEEHWSTHMFCEGYAVLVDTVSSCLESPWEIHISYKAP